MSRNKEFQSIIWLRGVAAWLVVWFHLCETYVRTHGIDAPWVKAVSVFLSDGLKINAGLFGVTLFFAVSGFIITHVALQESPREFTIKRLLRIYPTLISATLIYVAVLWGWWLATGSALEGQALPTIGRIVSSMLIFNGLFDGSWTINAVTWSLVIEVLFYTITLLLLPLLQRAPIAAAIVQIILFIILTRWPIPGAEHISDVLAASATLFAAQVIYLGWSRRISTQAMLALLLAWAITDQWAAHLLSESYVAANPVFVWRIYALMILGLLLALDERLPVPSLIRKSADMSYSVFLLHVPVGFVVLAPLTPLIGFKASIVFALAAVALVSWWSYRLIENPSQQLARTLLKPLHRSHQNKASHP